MSEKMIHLEFTPMQANHLALMVKLAKEVLAVAPGTVVYPNLGDFQMERELVKTAIDSTQKVLIEQLEKQTPKK
jgi:hypothetical protein